MDDGLQRWLDERGYTAAAPKLEAKQGGLYIRDGHRVTAGDEVAIIPYSLMLMSSSVLGGRAAQIPDHVSQSDCSLLHWQGARTASLHVRHSSTAIGFDSGGATNVALLATPRPWLPLGPVPARLTERV